MAMLEEELVALDVASTIGGRVKAWRQRGYRSVTPVEVA